MKSVERIAKRAMLLTVLVAMVGVERGWDERLQDAEMQTKYKVQVYRGLYTKGVVDEMTEEEHTFFQTPSQKTPFSLFCDFSWQYESIRPLLWALGLDELVSYARYDDDDNGIPAERLQVDTYDKAENFRMENLLPICKLRSRKEIETQAMVAMLWHWRAIELDTELPEGETWVGVVRRIFGEEVEEALKYIPHQQRGKQDFLVGKTPAAKLSQRNKLGLKKYSMWRQHAFEWILSDDDWDEVTTDT